MKKKRTLLGKLWRGAVAGVVTKVPVIGDRIADKIDPAQTPVGTVDSETLAGRIIGGVVFIALIVALAKGWITMDDLTSLWGLFSG